MFGDNLTVCVSAITTCQNNGTAKEAIVFCADRMISTGIIGQFEHTIEKYKKINGNTYAMLSGNPLIFEDLIKISNENLPYSEIRIEIFNNFKKKRKQAIQNEILELYGLNETYIKDILKQPIPNAFIEEILKKITGYSLQTEVLLLGYDDKNHAMISYISSDGIAEYRDIGFHTIGSGSIHAMHTLLSQKHNKKDGLLRGLYNVYKAKKSAEVMEGVGKDTDLLVLMDDKAVKISSLNMSILDSVYEQEINFVKTQKDLERIDINNL